MIREGDFFNIFMEESPFYKDLNSLDSLLFNNWISNSFTELIEIKSFRVVTPSEAVIERLLKTGYKHIEGQCHYIAKAVSLLDNNFEYWTGFKKTSNPYTPIYTHSFNIFNGKLIDFSRIDKNLETYNDDQNSYLPHTYYGIRIPLYFLEKYRQITLNEFSMNPLLYEWYDESTIGSIYNKKSD